MQGYAFEKRRQNKRWRMWKNVLIVTTYLVLVCGIVVGAIYLYPNLRVIKLEDEDVCLTENCLKSALLIASSIDPFQDPCYDFYQFTCGNFIDRAYENNNPSQYHTQRMNVAYKLNAIIAEPITGKEEGLYLQQKRFYQSCMDETTIDAEGYEPFLTLLEEIGGWPVLKRQQWNEEGFDINEIIVKCIDLGLPYQWFFDISLNHNWIGIYSPKIMKQYDDYYKESVYFDLIFEIVNSLGPHNTLALSNVDRVIQFEKKLETIAANREQPLTVIPLTEMNTTIDIILWIDFISNVTESYVPLNDSVLIFDETYLKQLNLLLAETPKSVQGDFIVWKIIQEFGLHLANPVRDMFSNFTNFMVHGDQQMNTRFKFCIRESLTRFPRIAEAEFIQKYVDEYKTETIKDMVSNIKKQFINRLNAADWIDQSTKEVGVNKVEHIVEIIGQHSLDFDENIANDFLKFSDLEFITSNIIDMVRKKNKDTFMQQLQVENATQIDYLTDFFFSKTLNVNAAYMEIQNIIFLPAGIIQDIFYDSNRPNYLNYGALGSIIGHEIAHAFSQIAATHDTAEETDIITAWYNTSSTTQRISELLFLNTTKLWQDHNLEALNKRMNCITEEMVKTGSNDEIHVAENFADLVGIDIAYEAYVAWAEQYENEQKLPGLPFSPKQLFWIQFGAVNCYRHVDSVSWTLDEDTHSTLRYRVLNTLKNSENFAKDFQCPEASVMNPLKKCHVF